MALLVRDFSAPRGFSRSIRAFSVAFIVVAALLSTVDSSALTQRKGTKYGTLSFTIQNLDGKYKPGQQYTIVATFAANDRVFSHTEGYHGYMTVSAGGRTLCSRTVIVRKNKTTSTSASFTAPTDGSTLKITFSDGFKDKDVFVTYTIPPMIEDVVEQEDTETSSSATDENSNSNTDTDNDSEDSGDKENANDNAETTNADEENSAGNESSQDQDFWSEILDNDIIKDIQDFWAHDPLNLDREATPEEAAEIGSVAALVALLLGGGMGGALGGGVGGALGGLGGLGGGTAGAAGAAGGSVPPPIEGPGGPSNPFQGVEDKYVTRDPDGSITIKDPITGESKLYLPDGQGGYDNPLGGGFKSETDMLEHLAYLDRNSGLLQQDAATAAKNQAEQHEQWVTQTTRDAERGYSDEMAEYREWKEQEERKQEQIIKLADKYYCEANEEAVKKAIKIEQIQAGIEAAKQEAVAADQNVTVVALESTRNVAATSLAVIPLALSGVGTVSVATMAKVKVVQSCYTMASSVTEKVGDAYVKGESLGKAAVHGVAEGTIGVAQNYAGDIGGKVAGLFPNAGKIAQGALNLGTEAAVVIGGEGVKAGLNEYNESGDLQKTLDATIKGIGKGAKDHAINKVVAYGIDKGKSLIKPSTPTAVQSTRTKVDDATKKVTVGQQNVTRTQQQVTTAKQRVTTAQQHATQTRQQVDSARGKVNAANEQLNTANSRVETARQRLAQASTTAQKSQASAELTHAQEGARQAQQNLTRANSELQNAQRIDSQAQRVAVNAEHNLQKAQFGAQKAQSDLRTATQQRDQALRDAYTAEQQAQVAQFNDKSMAHVSGDDIVGGYRSIEEHLKNEGYLPKDDD